MTEPACWWCHRPATGEVVLQPGGTVQRRGRKVYVAPNAVPACSLCRARFAVDAARTSDASRTPDNPAEQMTLAS